MAASSEARRPRERRAARFAEFSAPAAEWHPSAVAKQPPIVSRLQNASFGLWFPLFRRVAQKVPPEWLARLSEATVERAIWARESVREAILDNLSCVLGLPPDHPRVEEAALQMLGRHSRLWIDLLSYSGRSVANPKALVSSQIGTEHLRRVKAEGRGAIILTAHVGNFEVGGMFLREMGLDVHVVYAPDPSPVVESHRERARQALGVKGIPVTSSPFVFVPMLRVLSENGVLAIQGDRDYSGTGQRLPFFGRTASFPTGPFLLAATAGAPILPTFVLHDGDGLYRTVVNPPIHVAHTRGAEGRNAEVQRALRSFVATLEHTIRENPSQWYLFQRFWV